MLETSAMATTVPHAVLLSAHIVSGSAGLLIGPFAMRSDTRRLSGGQRPDGCASTGYPWIVLAVCLSAIVLVIGYRHDLWWLIPVAAASYALAVMGRAAAVRQFRGWTHAYVHGQGGSYIALVTALIVVALTVDGPLRSGPAAVVPWFVPALVGTPLIEIWRQRLLRARARNSVPTDQS
jgi:hypothetical protein